MTWLRMSVLSFSMLCSTSGSVMMGSSDRIRVPLGILRVAIRPLPFPGTSSMVYIFLLDERGAESAIEDSFMMKEMGKRRML